MATYFCPFYFLKSRDITLPTKVRIVKAMVFPVVMYRSESWTIKKADSKELMLLNCGAGGDSWESRGLQREQSYPFWRKSTLSAHWKDRSWSWSSNTLAISWEEKILDHPVTLLLENITIISHIYTPVSLPGKDLDVGKVWRQDKKGMTEDEMDGQCHWSWPNMNLTNLREAVEDKEGLACSGPWGHEESDTT